VAIPGDSLAVRRGQLYINGAPATNPEGMQFLYWIITSQSLPKEFFSERGISEPQSLGAGQGYQVFTTPDIAAEISRIAAIDSVYKPYDDPHNLLASHQYNDWMRYSQLFPNNSKQFAFTPDNYGPVWVPKKGVTVTLTDKNIAQFRRIIKVYEHNTLEERNGQFIINGKPTNQYTFKYDYYFMMGDNRHNSQDSRFWGFVPETHIVGKPWFIWLSIDKDRGFPNNIRWNRLFRGVK
jgi:signal peptidase I